jgi:hypothetical protein
MLAIAHSWAIISSMPMDRHVGWDSVIVLGVPALFRGPAEAARRIVRAGAAELVPRSIGGAAVLPSTRAGDRCDKPATLGFVCGHAPNMGSQGDRRLAFVAWRDDGWIVLWGWMAGDTAVLLSTILFVSTSICRDAPV